MRQSSPMWSKDIPSVWAFSLMGGNVHAATLVPHVDEKGDGTSWWDWMPFQKGQAQKTEALESSWAGKSKPTIEELEKILAEPDKKVSINPDGSVSTV